MGAQMECCEREFCERCHDGQKRFVVQTDVIAAKVCVRCAYEAALLDLDVSMIQ